jgi:cyanophycinase
MNRFRFLLRVSLLAALVLAGCQSPNVRREKAGHIMIVGGGLDDDLRGVYECLLKLASAQGKPRVLIATAATEQGEEVHSEIVGKTSALQAWSPDVQVGVITRETSTEDTVKAIDEATGILFTGGSQARITQRYRPEGRETPEWHAMKRLLARGGVIAGCSAGDAMMGEFMVLHGDNTGALAAPAKPKNSTVIDFKMSSGMALLPWAISESHFFERDRLARLVVMMETAGNRLGIGVGEDAAVHVDLATGMLTGLTPSDSLLIDATHLETEGQMRRGLRARLIRQGERVSLRRLLDNKPPPPAGKPPHVPSVLPITSPGQNRQLALWRLFMNAHHPNRGVWEMNFEEGWKLQAWPDKGKWVSFEVSPE